MKEDKHQLKLSKAVNKAKKYGENATNQDIEQVSKKMDSMKKGPLAKVWDKVTALWKGFNNPEVPAKYKAMIIGSLIYMVSPIDIIPDTIPVAGLLDDVFVITTIFQTVQLVIQKINQTLENIRQPILEEYITPEVNKRLNSMIKNSLINTAINFGILTAGMLLVIFKPINQIVSYYAASILFLSSMVWSAIRFIRSIPQWKPYAYNIIVEKSIQKGIAKTVCQQYKAIDVYQNFTKYLAKVLPAVKDYRLESLIKYYIEYFFKKMAIFVGVLAIYSVLICFVLKPILIHQFGGLNMWQLYFYPVIHIFKIGQY